MIEIKDIRKYFANGTVKAVDGVSFVCPDGQITGLLGPNGAGKTTALRVIAGLLKPMSGTVVIDGHDVTANPRLARSVLGVQSDMTGVYPRLTAREQLAYYGRFYGLKGKKLDDRVQAVIDLLDMLEIADRRAEGFSRGQRQKIVIGRALVHDPRNIIMDEPTNGLDVMAVRETRETIQRFAEQGRCVLFSTHYMDEAERLCDHIAIIVKGTIVAFGTPAALITRTGMANLEDAFVELAGGVEGLQHSEYGRQARDCNIASTAGRPGRSRRYRKMWARISNIWRKEIIDSLRDKKALRQALLIPFIVGIFYAAFNPWITSIIADKVKQPLDIAAQGIENAGQPFLDVLQDQKITLQPFSGDLQGAVARGEKPAGLIIPPGFSASISKEQPARLTLLTNHTSGGMFGGGFSGDRLDVAVNTYSRLVSTQRVQVRQLDPSLLNPVTVEARDLATPEQVAGLFAAFTLPLLLGSIIAQGGLFVAIDVTAGEKERGALESLLVTPASDFEVLAGKLAAVFTITIIPLVLTFTGFWAAGMLLPSSITNGGTLPAGVIIGAILMSLPLALFIDVVLMIVSVRTQAFKEAQSAATPLGFAVIAPAMLAAFVTPSTPLLYLVPVYGPAALVSAMATGTQLPPIAYLFAVLGSLAAAAVAFLVATRFFNRERLLHGV